jgi:hypothetical protein
MRSYTYSDLITYMTQSFPRLQADAAGALVVDMVQSYIWDKYDWRVALKQLPPFFLVGITQDYVAPYVTIPSDFLGLRMALLVYNGTEPPTTYPPLRVMRYLQKTYAQARTTAISYEAELNGFRIFPRCPSGIGVMDYQIECTYKTNPPKVTSATLMNTLPFDDQYFPVFVEGMKYFLKPAIQQTDADLQRFLAAIDMMAAHEAINLGDQPIAPSEPLVGY